MVSFVACMIPGVLQEVTAALMCTGPVHQAPLSAAMDAAKAVWRFDTYYTSLEADTAT